MITKKIIRSVLSLITPADTSSYCRVISENVWRKSPCRSWSLQWSMMVQVKSASLQHFGEKVSRPHGVAAGKAWSAHSNTTQEEIALLNQTASGASAEKNQAVFSCLSRIFPGLWWWEKHLPGDRLLVLVAAKLACQDTQCVQGWCLSVFYMCRGLTQHCLVCWQSLFY